VSKTYGTYLKTCLTAEHWMWNNSVLLLNARHQTPNQKRAIIHRLQHPTGHFNVIIAELKWLFNLNSRACIQPSTVYWILSKKLYVHITSWCMLYRSIFMTGFLNSPFPPLHDRVNKYCVYVTLKSPTPYFSLHNYRLNGLPPTSHMHGSLPAHTVH
jgi:hypothetical protein